MNIKELKANKKNRNLVLYLRKVVESYRAGFVSSKELKTDLHMDFKRVQYGILSTHPTTINSNNRSMNVFCGIRG
jgi:hypothetical protein